MKTYKKIQLFILFIGLLSFNTCVENDNLNIPVSVDVSFTPGVNDIVTDISSVLGDFTQRGEIFTYNQLTNGGSRYMYGYVISSDEGGNFFEEIVLQDKASNPTAGITVQVDVNPLYTFYEFGRKVYIKLDGLSVAENNGVLQIGIQDGTGLAKISSALRNKHIIRDAEVATIIPLELTIRDFSNDKESLFIRLNDVQFNRNEVLGSRPLTFAGEVSDEFDGERTIETCLDNASVILSTSTFSDFKALPLPINRGNIDGILTRDFFDEFYTLVINSPEDLNFNNDVRCDPTTLDCGLATTEGPTILFEDAFETQTRSSPITGNGWTNYIEAGSESWEAYTAGGSNASLGVSARMNSFNSGDASNIGWLITPAIDLNTNTGVTLSFQTSNSFSDGSSMEVLFSDNWDGTFDGISNATWGLIPAAYITQNSDLFSSWFDSGIVDLSCGSGSRVYFAFRYIGNGNSGFDGTYELDNIKITAN